MLDPNYLVPPNQELSVIMAALQENLDSLKHSLTKSPFQLSANNNQKTKFSIQGYLNMKFLLLYFTINYPTYTNLEPQVLSLRQKDVKFEMVARDRK